MEILVYAIVFSLVLIVSNATNKLIPTLPLPLIQIFLGIGLGFLLPNSEYHLDTELFLALVIGPLLFREAEEADITSILKHWRIIAFLIFPVIFISTLSLGWLALVVRNSTSCLYGSWGSARSDRFSGFCLPFGTLYLS